MNGKPNPQIDEIRNANGPSKFRGEHTVEVETLGEACGLMLQGILQGIGHHKIFRSCATCRSWVEGQGCGKFNQLPPVQVIVTGCDAYDDNVEIPF